MRSFLAIILFQIIAIVAFGQYEDTCITIQPGTIDDNDALIHSLDSERDSPYNNSLEIAINTWTFGGQFGIVRSLIDFEINKHLPLGMPVESAKLYLYAWNRADGMGPHSPLSGSNAAWVERIITSWDKLSVTWNNQPMTTTLNRVSMPASTSGGQDYVIDVTQLVKDMRNNPTTSFGFLFKLKTEDYYRRLTFCSANYPDPKKHPKLVICSKIPTPPQLKPAFCELIKKANLYPNPADEEVNLFIKDIDEPIDIKIYDCIGRQIIHQSVQNELTRINTAHLSQGVYIMEIQAETCGLIHRKIEINR